MLAACLVLLSAAAPDAGTGMPSARELAQSYFVAGDVKRAVDAARACMVVEGKKKCEPFYRALVEYKALVPNNEHLTNAEAKTYLEWDRLISPKTRGKLTEGVYRQYVLNPLEAARQAAMQEDRDKTKAIAKRVLEVEPTNEEALKLLKDFSAK